MTCVKVQQEPYSIKLKQNTRMNEQEDTQQHTQTKLILVGKVLAAENQKVSQKRTNIYCIYIIKNIYAHIVKIKKETENKKNFFMKGTPMIYGLNNNISINKPNSANNQAERYNNSSFSKTMNLANAIRNTNSNNAMDRANAIAKIALSIASI